jgi:hypothetical protein
LATEPVEIRLAPVEIVYKWDPVRFMVKADALNVIVNPNPDDWGCIYDSRNFEEIQLKMA